MDNLINEGGNAKAKNGATASKISLADFTPEQYSAFKHGLLNLVYELNKAFTKFAKEPLFPSEEAISSLKIFSGSGFEFFNRKREWNKIIDRGMAQDFSWNNSAGKYAELYNRL